MERKRCHWCQLRSFSTHKTCPVTIVNETGDGAVLSPQFTFIERSVLRLGVKPTEVEFRSGCDCAEAEDCMYDTCKCLDEVDDDDKDDDDGDDDDSAGPRELDDAEREILEWAEDQRALQQSSRQRGTRNGLGDGPGPSRPRPRPRPHAGAVANGRHKKRFSYHTTGAKAGLLRGAKLHSPAPIYECHEGCHCDKAHCPNRVVERGRQIPLQIFRTPNGRGWGVKAMRDVKRGQFVDCYLGEVLTPELANSRRVNATKAQRKDVYLFALDKFTDPDSPDPRLRGAPLEVDGEFMSGPTRFINHSCDPNLAIFARVGDPSDKHLHDLALFALCDIAKGTELTFDYVNGQGEIESNARDEALQGEMTKCLCGAPKCRGFLW